MEEDESAIVPRKCPLCEHPDREQLEEDLARGVITRKSVASELGMDLDEIHHHMREHFTTGGKSVVRDKNPLLEKAPSKLKELYRKRDVLFTTFVQLKDRLDAYLDKDTMSAVETKQITSMVESLRRLAVDLAKLEGEMPSERKITINMYNDLKMIILSTLCEECREKVLGAMADIEKETIDLTMLDQEA